MGGFGKLVGYVSRNTCDMGGLLCNLTSRSPTPNSNYCVHNSFLFLAKRSSFRYQCGALWLSEGTGLV